MSNNLTDKEIDDIKYFLKNWESLSATIKNISSLMDIKIEEFNRLNTVVLENKFLELEKSNNQLYSTRSALINSEQTTASNLKILKSDLEKAIEALEEKANPSIEVYQDVKGFTRVAKWLGVTISGIAGFLTIKYWDKL
jgi:hypothetical protein